MGVASWAAWVCSLLGTACGLVGLRDPARRTPGAVAAATLNGVVALATTALLWAL
jgi:hypothetical protein